MIGYVGNCLITIMVAVVSHIQSLPMCLCNKCYCLRSDSNVHILPVLITYTTYEAYTSLEAYESQACISSVLVWSTVDVLDKKLHP